MNNLNSMLRSNDKFKVVVFESFLALPGNTEDMGMAMATLEVYQAEVHCTIGGTGIAIEYVWLPELKLGLKAQNIGHADIVRLQDEAFEHLIECDFVEKLVC